MLFGMPSLHPFTFVMLFKSCFYDGLVVVGKVYQHHIGKALHSAAFSCQLIAFCAIFGLKGTCVPIGYWVHKCAINGSQMSHYWHIDSPCQKWHKTVVCRKWLKTVLCHIWLAECHMCHYWNKMGHRNCAKNGTWTYLRNCEKCWVYTVC